MAKAIRYCLLFSMVLLCGSAYAQESTEANRLPRFYPNYVGATIPPNISPLNCMIEEEGTAFEVTITGSKTGTWKSTFRKPELRIPFKEWRALLDANQGGQLRLQIRAQNANGQWTDFQPGTIHVAPEAIDSHISYRLMKPIYNYFTFLGCYQRNLETAEESVLLDGRDLRNSCVNCHTYNQNDPQQMILGVRSGEFGSSAVVLRDQQLDKIVPPMGITAWHPSGELIAFSKYQVNQFFHTRQVEIRDVIEMDSTLGYFDFRSGKTGSAPALMKKDRLEAHPNWSPDGKYLYFTSAPKLWTDNELIPPDRYQEVLYDLMRVPYDHATGAWGQAEMVLSAGETGQSITQPRISPDGRFLLFCMADYSMFPLNRPNADLYMMNLETRDYWPLDAANSDAAESWHSWSSNGRWIIFASKRDSVLFTRICIAHIDENGRASQAFLLPQKEPDFYLSMVHAYNVPELMTGPLEIDYRKLLGTARGPATRKVDGITGATPKAKKQSPATWVREPDAGAR
ncbi:MAG: hypothetical protein ACLFQ6_09525 [Candidatus Sumerlaeia bacterium]